MQIRLTLFKSNKNQYEKDGKIKTHIEYNILEGRESTVTQILTSINTKFIHHSFIGIGDKIHLVIFLKKRGKSSLIQGREFLR